MSAGERVDAPIQGEISQSIADQSGEIGSSLPIQKAMKMALTQFQIHLDTSHGQILCLLKIFIKWSFLFQIFSWPWLTLTHDNSSGF